MNTPSVLFVIFRRPEATARVFEAIRRARPSRLFVAADGPRPGRQDEAELCRQTRAVVERVDWPCQVVTRFQETNQGIKEGVTGAISWFFSQVDEGIILEDDCLPHPDFFPYCAALLKQYRDDERVFHVGGNNFQPKSRVMAESYYFSRYNHIWGWATWKRAWDRYRAEFEGLEDFLVDLLRGTLLPDLRASDRPMAMACFRLVTLRPDLPLFNVPFLRSRMALPTFLDAVLPYFLAIVAPFV